MLSSWDAWSDCSSNCGVGAKTRHRKAREENLTVLRWDVIGVSLRGKSMLNQIPSSKGRLNV